MILHHPSSLCSDVESFGSWLVDLVATYLLSRCRRCWWLLANSSSSLQSLQPQMQCMKIYKKGRKPHVWQAFNLKTAAKTSWHNERKHVNNLVHAQNTLFSHMNTFKVLIKSKSGTLLWACYMESSISKKRKKTTRRYESRKSNETKSFMYNKMECIIISNL